MKNTIFNFTDKYEFLFRLMFASFFIIAGTYAMYISQMTSQDHYILGHSQIFKRWSENAGMLVLFSLTTGLYILILGFKRKIGGTIVLSFICIMTSFYIVKNSYISISDQSEYGSVSSFYTRKISDPTLITMPSDVFVMSKGEAGGRIFSKTVHDVIPQIREMTFRTGIFIIEKGEEMLADPRFNWALTGQPPSPEAFKSVNESIMIMKEKSNYNNGI